MTFVSAAPLGLPPLASRGLPVGCGPPLVTLVSTASLGLPLPAVASRMAVGRPSWPLCRPPPLASRCQKGSQRGSQRKAKGEAKGEAKEEANEGKPRDNSKEDTWQLQVPSFANHNMQKTHVWGRRRYNCFFSNNKLMEKPVGV